MWYRKSFRLIQQIIMHILKTVVKTHLQLENKSLVDSLMHTSRGL